MVQAASSPPGTADIPRLPAVDGVELGRRLRELMRDRGWSVYSLSQKAKLSERHLGSLVGGEVDRPRPGTVKALADAFGLPVQALLSDDPGQGTLMIAVPDVIADTLQAVAAIRRSSIEGVIQDVVHQFAVEQSARPSVARVIEAVNEARQLDEPGSSDVRSE